MEIYITFNTGGEMKTVNDFIKELEQLKPELKNKPIFIQAPNGIYFEPTIKAKLKYPFDFENVNSIIITYD